MSHTCNIFISLLIQLSGDIHSNAGPASRVSALNMCNLHMPLSLLDHPNITQHVSFPTHQHSHTHDLFITSANSTLSPTVITWPISPTDHFPIICSLKITYSPTVPKTRCLTRALRAINIIEFCHDILSSCLITHPPSTLSDLVDCYNSTLSQLLNKYSPPKSQIISPKPRNPWYIQALKHT